MSLTLDEVHVVVRSLIAEGSGLDTSLVIPGNDDGPRPRDSYASVLYLRNAARAYPVFVQASTGTITTTQERASYSVQWYRTGSHNRAHDFVEWTRSELGLEAQVNALIRFEIPIELREPYATIGDKFEERQQADVFVHWISRLDQSTDLIDVISGTVEGTTISV